MDSEHLVSVWMITYNHEKYIRKAIEGVLIQQSDFSLELIVADDCSTDRTQQVVEQIIESHPRASITRYTRHLKNKGLISNFIWGLVQCKGKYIALCEGDDYWTDPYKLQKQVDFLEKNTEFSLCVHRAECISDSNSTLGYIPDFEWKHNVFELKDFFSYGFHMHTGSFVFRRECFDLDAFIKVTKDLCFGDVPLALMLTKHGKIAYLPDIMSCYRKHEGGATNTNILQKIRFGEDSIKMLTGLKEYFEWKQNEAIDKALAEYYLPLADQCYVAEIPAKVKKFIKLAIKHNKKSILRNIRMFVVLLLYAYFPIIFKNR